MPTLGRPPDFTRRARLVLYVEADELTQFHRVARAAGNPSTSAWARAVLVEVAAREQPRTHRAAPGAGGRRRRAVARARRPSGERGRGG
jgi:hypothetical protein